MKRFVCVLKESVYECVVLSYVLFLTKINIHVYQLNAIGIYFVLKSLQAICIIHRMLRDKLISILITYE
jgi:hypothetical protein